MFTANWCPACKATKKLLAQKDNADIASMIEIVDVETKAGEKLALAAEVQSIPTFVRPDGKKKEGGMTPKAMRAFLGIQK
jgi:glutaredoxin